MNNDSPMSADDCTWPCEHQLARQLAAMAHPARLSILRKLACHEACRCKDVVADMPLAQSTVSQHLKVLSEAGLVISDHRRPHSLYRIDRAALRMLGDGLGAFAQACCDPAPPQTLTNGPKGQSLVR